jgi:mRNA interferase YafO
MVVKITTALKSALDSEESDSSQFLCELFNQWKQAKDEYGSYHFDKDSAYITPIIKGDKYILRHVHLVPVIDKDQLSLWKRKWSYRSRKTSNRVLIYVDDKKGNYLLIYILSEPDAHEVALMKTQQHKELMEGFAAVAEAFIDNSFILA